MTTQFLFWRTKISVIKKSKTLVMKPGITHNIFLILNHLKREFTPHEAIQKFVSRHFTTSLSSHGRDVIQEECGFSYYRGFRGSEGEPTILSSEKVQQNMNIVEGDKRVSEIQVSAFAASWPLISLWNKIVTSDEDIEAEGVLDGLQQSLMCIGSAFKGLSVNRRKRFRSCLTKEFFRALQTKKTQLLISCQNTCLVMIFQNELSNSLKPLKLRGEWSLTITKVDLHKGH